MTDEPSPSDQTDHPATRGRTLALDVGSVRVGVAISSDWGNIAQPLTVVRRDAQTVANIARLCAQHEVGHLVVGKPLRLAGTEGPAVQAVEQFVATLQASLTLPLTWVDERLTTRQAERAMIAMGARRKVRRENLDKVAAVLILQGYLDGALAPM